jgi:hypothetical protein
VGFEYSLLEHQSLLPLQGANKSYFFNEHLGGFVYSIMNIPPSSKAEEFRHFRIPFRDRTRLKEDKILLNLNRVRLMPLAMAMIMGNSDLLGAQNSDFWRRIIGNKGKHLINQTPRSL